MRCLIVLAAVVMSGCGSPPDGPPEPKNLVILSIDTLRPDHLGLYGYPRDTSPTLDELGEKSAVFDQAITVHVSTAPAHGTVLTGRYPGNHGIQRNGMSLLPDVPTLAQVLGERGWVTGGFVSGWTLERHTQLDRGFLVYDDRMGEARYGAGARREGAVTTDAALAWLEDRIDRNERFFLFLHLFEPHWPYEPPVEDALRFLPGRSELETRNKPLNLARLLSLNRLSPDEQDEFTARYDGEIVVADRLLHRVLDSLVELGVDQTTVLVVLSDHGETLFERAWTMDHGTRPYEEQVRVPLVLFIPDDPSNARRVADQVSLLDVFPTILDIFGIPSPDGVQGRSLLPLARGGTSDSRPRPAFITARTAPDRVPHIEVPLVKGALTRAVRLPGLKLIEWPMNEREWRPELHNLGDDPGELVDLAGDRPEATAAFHRELARWQETSSGDPFIPAPELEPEVEAALRELGYIDD